MNRVNCENNVKGSIYVFNKIIFRPVITSLVNLTRAKTCNIKVGDILQSSSLTGQFYNMTCQRYRFFR